jgi:UDP-N-acetylglucosamine--dolichyl-phosphate N-acetylglucosaminephosphotransferase
MEIVLLVLALASSFGIATVTLPIIIRKMVKAGITGKDVNKKEKPEVAEMGGLTILMGAIGALLLAIAANTFFFHYTSMVLIELLAAMLTMTIISLIGTFDDLFDMRKDVKTVLPMVAALPLVALSAAGSTVIGVPFIGNVDFGILYIAALIPLGVTVSSNLTNMLAGFNGMEAGMGCVIFAATLLLSIANGSLTMGLISAAMLGALAAFAVFSWYPAKIFMGDIGTLLIGAALACAVILGNLEMAGFVLVLPYLADFAIKAINRFPSTKWWGELDSEGKLHPVEGKVRGLAQLFMKMANGISEQRLVILFIALECACALAALALFGRGLVIR